MIGPLMFDLESTELSSEEINLLSNPLMGGVILFSKNIESYSQVKSLVSNIRAHNAEIIIAIDQEGGRVQRLKEGFTKLAPLGDIGKLYSSNPKEAKKLARQHASTMVSEVLDIGIDISFTPVLDLNIDVSEVIGDRSFSADPEIIVSLAKEYIDQMHQLGMPATGKHFPGHGSVEADSHLELPVDDRSLEIIRQNDLIPFKELASDLDAIMPAHVIYSQVDDQPAGFSNYWIQTILREQLKFDGVVFSDDLNMAGAKVGGDFKMRAKLALDAGCDMILVCNNRQGTLEVIEYLSKNYINKANPRLIRLQKGTL